MFYTPFDCFQKIVTLRKGMALDNKVSHPKKTAWDYTCIALKSESVAVSLTLGMI